MTRTSLVTALSAIASLLAAPMPCRSAAPALAHATAGALAVSVSFPYDDEDGHGSLLWGPNRGDIPDKTPHFHVVIRNVSGRALLLPRESCAAGLGALSFQFTGVRGKIWAASRHDLAAVKDSTASYWTLLPGEPLVLEVYFTRRDQWGDSFWLPPGNPTGMVTLKAIYHCPAVEGRPEIWSGTVVSAPAQCVIK